MTAPCWYVDREPWEEAHFATEAQAQADADAEAAEDDQPPHPVRRHDQPCQEALCRDCGGVFHAPGGRAGDGVCAAC